MKKTRKPKRNSVKNPSLKKNYNSKIRQEYLDQDYFHKLDDTVRNCKLPSGEMVTELEYMSIFMKEYNSGGVGKQSEAKKNKIHRTPKLVKECTDRTNARNRDQYGRAKATGRVVHSGRALLPLDALIDWNTQVYNAENVEDSLIDYLDHSKELGNASDDGEE